MSDVQLDLFESYMADYVDTRSDLEKENEELKNTLMSYVCSDDESVATEKFLMLIVKRMGRYLNESNRKRIILSAFYTIHNDTDEETFENVLNSHIHDFNLRCYEWDDYLAERMKTRRRR